MLVVTSRQHPPKLMQRWLMRRGGGVRSTVTRRRRSTAPCRMSGSFSSTERVSVLPIVPVGSCSGQPGVGMQGRRQGSCREASAPGQTGSAERAPVLMPVTLLTCHPCSWKPTNLEPHKGLAAAAALDGGHHHQQAVQHPIVLQARSRTHGVATERLTVLCRHGAPNLGKVNSCTRQHPAHTVDI